MTKLKELEEKKILIVGLGQEGESSFNFFRSLFPKKKIGLADQKGKKDLSPFWQDKIEKDSATELLVGKDFPSTPGDYDFLVRTPGISLDLPLFRRARETGVEISSQTKIFFDNSLAKIIGVTGTKGKSTVTSLIYHLLKTARFKAYLVGNIGNPILSLFANQFSLGEKDSFYVYELSSHQLADLDRSPEIAVFTNLYPDHLDYFSDLEAYRQSKLNLLRFQKEEDIIVYNLDDPWLSQEVKKQKGKSFAFSLAEVEEASSFLSRDWLCYRQEEGEKTEKIIMVEEIPLKGKFNLQNVMAAIIVGRQLGISSKIIREAIKSFESLEHRLAKVGIFKKITFYDDSNATIPEATIGALDFFRDQIGTLIIGGSEKDLSFQSLAEKILEIGIKNLILFPTTGEKIWQLVSREVSKKGGKGNLPKHFFARSMEEAVRLAYQWTEEGKICLLSPASASFTLFRNYRERGELFQKWVKKLGV
jgi:UDP-N-acetylmuramoylalanine--D-glutamate ligase